MWAVVPFSGPVPELISDLLGGAGTGDETLVLRLVGVLLGAALLASIALAWRHARSLRVARKNLEIAKIDTSLIGAALNSASGSFWAWPSESETEEPGLFGPGLANLFGVSEDFLKADGNIYENLDSGCRRQLRDHVVNLRSNGAPFAMRVVTVDAKRSLEARGLRSSAKNTQADDRTWDTIWFRDVTGVVVEKNRLIDQTQEMTVAISGYRHLFDGLNIPAWVRGPDLSIVYCNDAYAHAVDQPTPQAAIAEGSEIAGGPMGWGKDLAEEARDGGAGRTRSTYVVMGGERCMLEITESPLVGGGDWSMAGFAIDCTDQDIARSELARHIASHGEVLESLGTGIVVFGPDTRLQFYNIAFARMWEYDPEWLRSLPTHGEMLEDLRARRAYPDQADFQAFKRQRMELYTSLIASQEEVIYLPDGRTFRMVINPHPLGGLLITVEDVTDRLTLERSYNTLIAVQSETLDHLHEGVVVFGSDSRLKLFNPAYARIWKLDSRMLRGEPRIHEIIDASQPLFKYDDNWEALREKLLSGVHDRTPRTGRFERADGSILDFSVVPLPDGALLFSYIDVTDSVTVQRALRERNDALLAADQLKSEFVTNVSYELRTPLNTIIGFTEILSNQYFGSLNDRQGEYTRGVLEASQVLLALIDDILDLARIEAGQLELEISQVNIHTMLAQVITLVQEKARKDEIALELECPEDIGTMAGDERRLKQALFNLVSNAIKYTPKGGLIRVSALRTSAGLDFAVTDTGIGIAEEDQARVMGRFERGSSDRDERARGMGLGLALVKSFIELHDGQLSIASQVGEGTTVRFVIPVDDGVENTPDQ